jgi:SAM-dependent methyltransferase
MLHRSITSTKQSRSGNAQEDVFLNGEGDQWFMRKRGRLSSQAYLKGDAPLELIKKFCLRPKVVLEIGASNGFRLNEIHRLFQSDCYAVDPSRKAIQDGRRRYPHVHFYRGVLHSLPSPIRHMTFDLVIINFVLHWIDRTHLLNSIAEVDRVLSAGDFLILGDFLPSTPERVHYHHLPGKNVWTYKQNYSHIFTASCLYEEMGTLYASHAAPSNKAPHVDGKISTHLLKKEFLYKSPSFDADN